MIKFHDNNKCKIHHYIFLYTVHICKTVWNFRENLRGHITRCATLCHDCIATCDHGETKINQFHACIVISACH